MKKYELVLFANEKYRDGWSVSLVKQDEFGLVANPLYSALFTKQNAIKVQDALQLIYPEEEVQRNTIKVLLKVMKLTR